MKHHAPVPAYIVNLLAAVMPDELDAGVPFYGTPAAEELRTNVRGPLMLQFGGLDERVNATWPDYEAVLEANGAEYIAYFYEGVNHGFHNDSTGRYNEATAELAWSRTIEFFKEQYLRMLEENLDDYRRVYENPPGLVDSWLRPSTNPCGITRSRRSPMNRSISCIMAACLAAEQ